MVAAVRPSSRESFPPRHPPPPFSSESIGGVVIVGPPFPRLGPNRLGKGSSDTNLKAYVVGSAEKLVIQKEGDTVYEMGIYLT